MQRLTYVVFISLAQCRGGKRQCQPCVLPTGDLACSLASRPMTVSLWSGKETSYAHAYKIRKWRPSQRMAFTDQGEFEAMKTLSSCRAPRCDQHQFHIKMTVST